MKTSCVSFLLLLLATVQISAQVSRELLSFQGVARNATGQVAANTEISLRISIHTFGQPTIFSESHKVHTNPQGNFNIFIGGGQQLVGDYAAIDWKLGQYFLQVEMDPSGGTNYQNMGSTQMVSVPFAIHAKQTDYAFAADRWKNGAPVIQTGSLSQGPQLPALSEGPSLIWHPRKAAFRAGLVDTDAWDESNMGVHSASFGKNTKAFGISSFAVGTDNESRGQSSFSSGNLNLSKGSASTTFGTNNIADGLGALATGINTRSVGNASLSSGNGTIAKAFAAASFGTYNNVQDNPSGSTQADAKSTDRIFQIGNGSGETNLSNAFTMLRDGRIGLGNGAIDPKYILDIDGRPRIRHHGETAGIYFSDTQNQPASFVGMKTDTQVGFYIGNAWRFWIDVLGDAHVGSGILQTSDQRLKKNLTPLGSSLMNIARLNGYHYFWKDQNLDQTLQTGLIAQEVEQIFPELVKTDDSGFKSVNYTGLIPYLIESVKELKIENEKLKRAAQKIAILEDNVSKLIEASRTGVVTAEQFKK